MINFFTRKKQVVIDCFTDNEKVYNFFKIEHAIKHIPRWYKSTPNTIKEENAFVEYIERPTIKSCYGFLEYYKNAYALRLWSDLIIQTNESGYGYAYADQESLIEQHTHEQTNNHFSNKYCHIKLIYPWIIKSQAKSKFLLTPSLWNDVDNFDFHDNVCIPSGILSFAFQRSANINCFVKKPNVRLELPAGITLAHLVPLTEDKILFKHHLVGKEEFNQIQNSSLTKCFFKNNMKKSENFYARF